METKTTMGPTEYFETKSKLENLENARRNAEERRKAFQSIVNDKVARHVPGTQNEYPLAERDTDGARLGTFVSELKGLGNQCSTLREKITQHDIAEKTSQLQRSETVLRDAHAKSLVHIKTALESLDSLVVALGPLQELSRAHEREFQGNWRRARQGLIESGEVVEDLADDLKLPVTAQQILDYLSNHFRLHCARSAVTALPREHFASAFKTCETEEAASGDHAIEEEIDIPPSIPTPLKKRTR